MEKTNLLIVAMGNVTPNMVETLRVYGMLNDMGVLIMMYKKATTIKRADIEWCDTALFVRSGEYIEYGLIKLFRKYDKYCIYTIDDDILSLGLSYGKDGEGYWEVRKKTIKKILGQANLFLGVNELLAKKYIEIGGIPKYAITNTIVEHTELFKTRQTGKNNDIIKIALYVNDGTTDMFDHFIRPVLPLLCKKYPNRIALYLMALRPDISEIGGEMNIVYVPHMPYKDFKEFMGTEAFDIGLAPLDNKGFSAYKYFNKYVEYTVAGIPAIYSDCNLYKTVINNGVNGMLCKDSKGAWYDTICDLIDNPQKRLELIEKAQEHIFDNYNRDRVLGKLIADIPQLVSYKSPKYHLGLGVSFYLTYINICEAFYRIAGWGFTAKQYIRQGKIRPMIKRIDKHFIHR